jgi:hypothetical protein
MPERVLTRSDAIVVSVGPVQVYSTGILVTFRTRFGPSLAAVRDQRSEDLHRLIRYNRPAADDDLMTMGVRYADGSSRATTALPETSTETAIYLDAVDAGGGSRMWRFTFWVWPPTTDDITFFAAWPARNVPTDEVTLPSADLATARAAVQHLDWPDTR